MAKRTPPLFPRMSRQLAALGERIRLARVRRRMSQAELAARTNVSIPTIRKLEKGDASSSLATLARVLTVLGLNVDLDDVAAHDELGRKLQDLHQKGPRRTKGGSK